MPRSCRACTHPERERIDASLIQGEPFRNIAKRYGLSATGLIRHKRDHLMPFVGKELARRENERGVRNVDQLERQLSAIEELASSARRVRRDAEKRGDDDIALKAVRVETLVRAEARNTFEFLAAARGETMQPHAGGSMVAILIPAPPRGGDLESGAVINVEGQEVKDQTTG